MNKIPSKKGYFYIIFTYFLWGVLPLYWWLLRDVNSLQILGFRILFSLLLVGAILLFHKNSAWLSFYKEKRQFVLIISCAYVLCFNWALYIYAINSNHALEASIGYYINPLVSIIFGLFFFREKLKILQWLAFALAAAGVLVLAFYTRRPPWISLGLAVSFGLYGLLKKNIKLSALESLGIEMLVAAPLGILLLFTNQKNPDDFFSIHALSYIPKLPLIPILLILGCGAVTSFPLFLFAKCTKLLPLSTIGFAQFLAPTLTFFEGIYIFHEPFLSYNFIVFGFIWAAVILYIISLKNAAPIRSE